MGRNETTCLRNISCDSMEQQTMKVRPALLKRKNFDSSELLHPSSHRRNKSQQVRFKEDTTNTNPSRNTGSDSKSIEHTQLINGKTEKCHSRSIYTFSYPKSQKGLQASAVQTSPSLRKPFPVIKERRPTTEKHMKESSGESSFVQFNGDLSDENLATQLSHLKKGDKLEGFWKKCPLKQTVSKAQNNGPINECSGMEFEETFKRVTVSTQVPDISIECTSVDSKDARVNLQTNHALQPSIEYRDKSNFYCTQSSDSLRCSNKNKNKKTKDHFHPLTQDKAEELKASTDTKRITTLTSSLNCNLSQCFHSESRTEKKIERVLERVSPSHYSETLTKCDQGAVLQEETISKTKLEDNTTQHESSKCTGGEEQSYCFPKNETHYKTNGERKDGNPGHKAHGEFCTLQGKLKSIEESLQSNHEKIKILLNVIQDLEKSRAISEGRNFYRTGQDLNNCSTCQNTACIIYSVEYDFRQQEGRFHQVLKELDKAEPSPILTPIQKPETDNVIPEKQDIRKKAKKVKKKCFWWI
uniref:Inhibitory synaptic factor family member 2B n=1 Tax=Leptobrachium leishanense TaxID=445787 RepID=A0A8C5Q8Z9_9ANUR